MGDETRLAPLAAAGEGPTEVRERSGTSAPALGGSGQHFVATLSVDEAARQLGIGRNLAYELVKDGTIPALRFRRKWRIPREAFQRWLQTGGGKF